MMDQESSNQAKEGDWVTNPVFSGYIGYVKSIDGKWARVIWWVDERPSFKDLPIDTLTVVRAGIPLGDNWAAIEQARHRVLETLA